MQHFTRFTERESASRTNDKQTEEHKGKCELRLRQTFGEIQRKWRTKKQEDNNKSINH